jgi:citrate synthase
MQRSNVSWLSAAEASERLGVRRSTLYAYVSRGLVRARNDGSARVYARDDVDKLLARSRARRGHGAVAAGALHWGEPVLDTRVSRVELTGPFLRGKSALELSAAGVSPERTAELLWTGELPASEVCWPALDRSQVERIASMGVRHTPRGASMLLGSELLLMSVADPELEVKIGEAPSEADRELARGLLRTLALAPALARGPAALRSANRQARWSAAWLAALGVKASPRAVAAVDQALVIVADHELNASTFAARVAASAGADLPRCLAAALATLSGSRHGGTCQRIERELGSVDRPERALGWVRSALAARREIPGFGHPLYPAGDPRARPLLELAETFEPHPPALRAIRVACEAMELGSGERPTLDLGLVALSAALRLPPGASSALFALGRSIGYVAHVFEQREQAQLLRPRARYVGT